MKTDAAREVEDRVQERIYASLGLPLPTMEEAGLIKRADIRSVNAEGCNSQVGPRGFRDIQQGIDWADSEAFDALKEYLSGFNPADCLFADGAWVRRLETRLYKSITNAHKFLIARNHTLSGSSIA